MRYLLLLAFVYLASAQPQPELCTAGDFNIQPLLKPDYWILELDQAYCKHFSFSDTCTLYFSFCQRLPPISGCEDDLGPTSLCVSNGTIGYSLGAYDNSMNPFQRSIDSSTLMAQYEDGSQTEECLDALSTTILFSCDVADTWEGSLSSGHGVPSSYLKAFFVDFEEPCAIIMTVGYKKVCQPAACEADHHDTHLLSSVNYWKVGSGISEHSCRKFFKSGNCSLYLSFCKPLSGTDHCKDFVNTSVCITNGTTDYSLGSYNYLINPFVSFSNDSFIASYNNGSYYPECPNTYPNPAASIITFQCAVGATWSQSGGQGDASDHFESLEPNPAGACQLLMKFMYSGACPNTSGHKNDDDNVGWPGLIILLLLAAAVTVYLVVGSIYNVANGKSSCPEMLPQYAFWRSFFMSAIEGVFFTADFITCGLCSQKVGPPTASQYEKL